MIRRLLLVLALGSSVLLLPGQATAQKKGGGGFGPASDAGFVRSNPKFLAAFREVVASAAKSTVRVLCEGKDTALGVVPEDGYVLTKANDLKEPITCRLRDGRVCEAELV